MDETERFLRQLLDRLNETRFFVYQLKKNPGWENSTSLEAIAKHMTDDVKSIQDWLTR